MRILYGCQRVLKGADEKLAHTTPILIAEGEKVSFAAAVLIDGPSEFITDRTENRPAEVRACKDHVHSIWLQTEAPVIPLRETAISEVDGMKRIFICGTVAKAEPGVFKAGAVVISEDSGQRCVKRVKILGPSRMIFDERKPIDAPFCPCKQPHSHRLWLETESDVEVIE